MQDVRYPRIKTNAAIGIHMAAKILIIIIMYANAALYCIIFYMKWIAINYDINCGFIITGLQIAVG